MRKLQIALFPSLSLLIAMLLIACGAQPEQITPNSQRPESQAQEEQPEIGELAPVALAAGEKLKVVATTNIIGDLVHNVGGELVELRPLLPTGADPHTFNPTPQDAAAVADAHLVFVNGLNLEEFVTELIENAGSQAPVVELATGVETREFETPDRHAEVEGDHYKGVDPHIWMSPANAMVMVGNIEQALSARDPANAETYKANAETYRAQLAELDVWVKNQIESIPAENRELVTDHDVFGYYADRYGLDVVGAVVPAYSTNAEPSAQELAALQQEINKVEAKALFVGTTVNPVLAERITEDTGLKLVPLYTDSLGQAGSDVETYLDLIRYNTMAIVEALQ